MNLRHKKLSFRFPAVGKAIDSARLLSSRFKKEDLLKKQPRISKFFSLETKENLLFFKQMLKNPKTLGAITPSSQALGAFISKHVRLTTEGYCVEIGAGTGSLSLALLQAGMDPSRLFVVELDPVLAEFLQQKLPTEVTILTGDARSLSTLLPHTIIGKVDTVISGIPMMNLKTKIQTELIQSSFEIMQPHGSFLQFSYGPMSPLPAKKLGLKKTRIGHVLLNIPPASIWRYERKAA